MDVSGVHLIKRAFGGQNIIHLVMKCSHSALYKTVSPEQ